MITKIFDTISKAIEKLRPSYALFFVMLLILHFSLNLYQNEFRFLYKGIIIKHNKTEPTYTKTSLFLCEKRRFFMGRTEKGGKVF